MRHLRPLDRALLLILVPLWAVCFVLSVRSAVLGVAFPAVVVSLDTGARDHPTVGGFSLGVREEESGLRTGDRLLELGDTDLRGVGNLAFLALVAKHTGSESVPVVFERDAERGKASLRLASYASNWPLLFVSFVFAATGLLLGLRAHPSPLVRVMARTLLLLAIAFASKFGASLRELYAAVAVFAIASGLAAPLALRAVLLFPAGVAPTGLLARVGPWIFSAFGLIAILFALDWVSFGLLTRGLEALAALFAVTFLVVVTRRYRGLDPIGRRQGKWVLWGVWCTALVRLAAWGWLAVVPGELSFQVFLVSSCAVALVPLTLLVAIIRYNAFDVDRLLSATASYNLVLMALLAIGLAVVPRFGELSSQLLGLDPQSGQLAVSLLLAAVVVPAHQRLRPRIERVFFKERFALDQGIAELLRALATCENTGALAQSAGEALQRLLRPEACVVYARVGESFTPVFVAGPAVPPAFEAGSPLVATLFARRKLLALSDAGRRPDDAALGPFDRAALEALAAEVVVPVHQGEALPAFLCLGPKRSGDVYSATDLSHLAAVAEAVSSQLRRFDQEQVIRAGRVMQESLRRYVPGAVAEELVSGSELASGAREVSVLFVDLRGYTTFAESRRPDEIFSTVNRYTEAVSTIVRAHGGSVVEFNGDGMMAVFGAPRELAHKERAAAEAGRAILAAVADLPVQSAVGGATRLSVGIGIATGEAFVGNIRAADRMIWSAIGNTTNLAARLQGLTRALDAAILIDAPTWRALGAAAEDFVPHAAVEIRGRRQVEDVYALPLGKGGAISASAATSIGAVSSLR